MKIFLSSIENAKSCKQEGGENIAYILSRQGIKMKWNLLSFYYIKEEREAEFIRDNSELIMVDSGAHSFQFGKKVNWDVYTDEYAEFIKRYDRENVVGYFEMDIENVIGYEAVLKLRKKLEAVSNKIIPVWHPIRGIDDYEKMCAQYAGKVIAIGGFKGTDIKDEQYLMFMKVARKYDCKVHCLGMTRREVLDKVPFDYTDSSTWSACARHGVIGQGKFKKGKVSREFSRNHIGVVFTESYKQGMLMQEHYYQRWKKECKD